MANTWSVFPYFDKVVNVLGSMQAINQGVDPSHTVAIQCLVGRTFGKFFVLNGPASVDDCYSGMKLAFGAPRELFAPTRIGGHMSIPPLVQANFDELVNAAARKNADHLRGSNPNHLLYVKRQFPLWRWAWHKYDFYGIPTFLFGILGLGLLPIVAIAKWKYTRQPPIELFVFAAVFTFTEGCLSILLDISKREVCYIRVTDKDVSPKGENMWEALFERARWNIGPPPDADDGTGRVKKWNGETSGSSIETYCGTSYCG
ncbi:hypothetical protein Aspvir_002902 [Aspergillus viridinutans]|uniref:Uncharacterized protein n=1 Tax=Aspergillus viridinutans TaxID=75553 RepID=A0A9P3F6Q6_ASPVI|nr:uncharacterized protein Aspvir_002902 [Aspergillus viridinutans]GIK07244.1 hypothetical protein Aspvir_002902 [Aspergillus viridinutans]